MNKCSDLFIRFFFILMKICLKRTYFAINNILLIYLKNEEQTVYL